MKIWIDADACPRIIKEIVFRASERLQVPVCLVANKDLSMTGQALDQIEDGHSSLSRFRGVSPGVRLAFPLELDHFYQFKTPGTCHVHVTAHGPLMDASHPLSTGIAEIKIVAANPASKTAATNEPSGSGTTLPTNRFAPTGKN